MARRDFILDLGKLLIGIAWIDARLQPAELNALKELLFVLPDLSGEDWMQLELYTAHVVTDAERQVLLDRVLSGIRSARDTQLVLQTLATLAGGDEAAQSGESAFFRRIRRDIDGGGAGLFTHLIGPFRRTLRRNARRYEGAAAREDRMEDFIKNTIYFQLTLAMQQQGRTLTLTETEARKACLAAGLMAHVAWVDHRVCHREREAMRLGLEQLWALPPDDAQLITDMSHARIMHGLDLVRLTTGFRACTAPEERKAFIRCLFAIANAAEQTSHAEIEAIRHIAASLDLPHREFINAKLSIPRHDRGGL